LKRLTITACAAALASFALIGTTGASGESRAVQAKQCAAMKKADKAAFKATFGKHAMRKCIKEQPIDPTVSEFKNAAKECKAERAEDPDAFRETYGSNPNGRNALGKCVSSHVKNGDDDNGDNGDNGDVA
jgi:hypothetical protein